MDGGNLVGPENRWTVSLTIKVPQLWLYLSSLSPDQLTSFTDVTMRHHEEDEIEEEKEEEGTSAG